MKQISLGYQSELAWDGRWLDTCGLLCLTDLQTPVASSIFHVIAIGVCFLRIFIRLKRGMLWWDDRIIALGALYNFVTISTLWAKPPCASCIHCLCLSLTLTSLSGGRRAVPAYGVDFCLLLHHYVVSVFCSFVCPSELEWISGCPALLCGYRSPEFTHRGTEPVSPRSFLLRYACS